MGIRKAVIDTIAHRCPSHVPWQLDLTAETTDILAHYYGTDDFLYTKVGNHLVREKNKRNIQLDPLRHMDIFGIVWQKEAGGDIGAVTDYPLKDASLAGYAFPAPDRQMLLSKCTAMVAVNPDRFRIFEFGFSLFERAWTLRGMEALLMDMILEPAFVRTLFGKLSDYLLEAVGIVCGTDVDAVMFGDDWGQQSGLIMGAPLWRAYIKPIMTKLFEEVKKHGKYVFLHSCGDLREIMGELVEMGLDVYNTFQPEIYDMSSFKREYSSSLTIYGGISTQGVLFHGSPESVRDTTLRTVEIMASSGGYIAAPTHQIPSGTPIENILAFIETIHTISGGV